MKKKAILILITVITVLVFCACGNAPEENSMEDSGRSLEQTEAVPETEAAAETEAARPEETTAEAAPAPSEFQIPEYSGEPSVVIDQNRPHFDDALKTEESFESYEKLDKRGRCGTAAANLSVDLQPAASEGRGDISSVHPSGWKSGQGWERCHLIGWQLAGENDNERNLVTGTHYMNVDGMLPYENEVAWYIEETGNHVLYEVTPVFRGKNMVCSGVHMQAESVEDGGDGVSFNVFCFNVSPGHEINYKTGEVTVTDEQKAAENRFERTYVLNTNTMRFHYPSCSSAANTAEHNKETVHTSREELIRQGYQPCGNCEP